MENAANTVRRGRKPYKGLQLELNVPPQDAHEVENWIIVEGCRKVRLGECVTLPGAVSVQICAAVAEQPRDLNGLVRSAVALLAVRRVIAGADAVVDTTARWDRTVPKGTMRVAVKQAKPPLERIGAETRRQNAEKLAAWRADATAAVQSLMRPQQ